MSESANEHYAKADEHEAKAREHKAAGRWREAGIEFAAATAACERGNTEARIDHVAERRMRKLQAEVEAAEDGADDPNRMLRRAINPHRSHERNIFGGPAKGEGGEGKGEAA
jgi:hypothetical protein